MSNELKDYFGDSQSPQALGTDKAVTKSETKTEAAGEKPKKGKQSRSSFEDRRTAARVAAVQALFQLDQSEKPDVLAVLRDFVLFRAKEDLEGLRLGKFDRNLFQDLVAGVWEQQVSLDDMLTAVLPVDWNAERIDPVLKAILRCGIFELDTKQNLTPGVVIGEYMSVAHGFFEGNEPRVINGALDTIAKTLREGEILDL